jgi:hypothetical protein
MKLFDVIQQVVQTCRLTADTERQIDQLLWSSQLDSQDMKALEKFIEYLSNGTIQQVE